jgi:hypothetical protein
VDGTRPVSDRPVALREYLDERRQLIRDFAATPTDHAEHISRLWTSIFPMAIEFTEEKLVLVLLDSNAPSEHVLTNAFGFVTEADVDCLRHIPLLYPGWSHVVALHHHVALPPLGGPLQRLQARAMVMRNASFLAEALLAGSPVVVFHGHRHVRFEGEFGDKVQVISAASTTLGDEVVGTAPGFCVVDLETSGSSVQVRELQWVPLPEPWQ